MRLQPKTPTSTKNHHPLKLHHAKTPEPEQTKSNPSFEIPAAIKNSSRFYFKNLEKDYGFRQSRENQIRP